MSKLLMAAALTAAIIALPAQAAVVGFTDAFAPSTWAPPTITGNLPSGDGGSVTFTPSTLTIVGGDNPALDPDTQVACTGAMSGDLGACQISTTHSVLDPISFHWLYATTDIGPGPDIFGVLIDGVLQQLSDPGGPLLQSGNLTISPSSTFGFFINCTDCVGGSATATISAFQAGAVPEPGTIALLGVGVVMVGLGRQKRRGTMLAAA